MKKNSFLFGVVTFLILFSNQAFSNAPLAEKDYKKIFESAETYFENVNYTAALCYIQNISYANEKIFIQPEEGILKISCSDDKGRNTNITVTVKYVDM